MTKGNGGQTCAEAIRSCFPAPGVVRSYSDIFVQVRTMGSWTDTTIRRYLMSTVVNLIPARYEWSSTTKFLFLRPDGQYEMYCSKTHPDPIEGANNGKGD